MADEEVSIDFSKIKGQISSFYNSVKGFISKNPYIIPVVLILIAICFSTYFRMYPASLPITDKWGESTVYNNLEANIKNSVEQQYPNLPDSHKQKLIDEQLNKYVEQNKGQIDSQVTQLSESFKSRLQDEDGQTYLLAIDPYLWYGYVENFYECENSGCYEIKEGFTRYHNGDVEYVEEGTFTTLRRGRFGRNSNSNSNFLIFIGMIINEISKFFGNNSLLTAFFLIPVVLMGLACIPAFFIGKKISGNIAGFFGAMFIALSTTALGRTPAGFSDTDSSNILFPLLIFWFFLEAMTAKNKKMFAIWSILTGIGMYVYAKIWYPEYVVVTMLASSGMYFLTLVGKYIYNVKIKNNKSNQSIGWGVLIKQVFKKYKYPLVPGIIVSLAGGFGIMFVKSDAFIRLFKVLFKFIVSKDVAVTTIWPNVLTTVAEFNEVAFTKLIDHMGGNIFFIIAVFGIIYLLFKKDNSKKNYNILYFWLLFIWFTGMAYTFVNGVRFALLLVPAFGIAFGLGIDHICNVVSGWFSSSFPSMKRKNVNIIIAILFCFIFLTPISQAHNVALNEIPSYNDAWDSSLDEIKADAEDGIGYITTWWDFGHWFVAKDIRVTFDGGDQGKRIYWVGNLFLNDDSNESLNTLRMLNCGQNHPYEILNLELNDSYEAVMLTKEIINTDVNSARKILSGYDSLSEENISTVLDRTHCVDSEYLPQYVITSEDMVGKAGVWGHFGAWDFNKAFMYQSVKNKKQSKGVEILMNKFNMSESEAVRVYTEIKTNDADRWISPWPGYVGDRQGCRDQGESIVCNNGLIVNKSSMKATIATQQGKRVKVESISYIDKDGKFKVKRNNGETAQYSAIFMPDMTSQLCHPLLVDSMFTRLFFFDGVGLENHFRLIIDKTQLNGQKIRVWKIDFDGFEKDIVEENNLSEEELYDISTSSLVNNISVQNQS